MITLRKSSFPIGLSFSDSILRAVELKKTGEKIKINALSKYRLKPGIICDGEIKNKIELLKAINILLKKTKFGTFNTSEVVASLPDSKTFIKLITVEKTINSLIQSIEAEIEKHIPLPLKNIYFDWQVISEDSANYQILIGVAPKNITDQYIEILNDAKLSIIALEIESISIARALLKEEARKFDGEFNKNYCLIDIGAKRTGLAIYSKGTIATSVSLPISSDESTELIAKSLEIDIDKAEKAKSICGLDPNQAQGVINEILSKTISVLAEKIETSLDFFNKHYPNAGEIDEIIICGTGANIKNLDKALFEKTKILTRFGNPLTNLNEITENLEKYLTNSTDHKGNKPNQDLSSHIISYSVAVGLALRSAFIDTI